MERCEKLYTVNEQLMRSIEAALDKGYRVELLKDRDGCIKAQIISRKLLKPDTNVNAPSCKRN